jgi:ribonuclease BN (tRNA processing enzyme)
MCPRGARLLAGHGGLLETTKIVAHCLLIEAGGQLVLVDTGFGLGDCSNPKRLGQPFRALVSPACDEGESAIRQIEALGHDPADVRHIVTTHLDLDHAGGIGDFPEAQIHVFAAELAAARSPSLTERTRYISEQWGESPIWVEHGAGGDSWFGFESIRVIPSLDAEIAMIPLPGHTAGHCGDAFFFRGEIETPRRCPPGLRFFQTLNQHDGKARHRNQERLRELQRDHGDEVTLFCSHDAQMLETAQ